MPWVSVGLERLSGQSWWASLRRSGWPGNSTMVQRIEGVVMYVLQMCISSGNWPESSLRISLLGESRQFCNIPPSCQIAEAWQTPAPHQKPPTHKHRIQRRVLLIATCVCSLVFCLVGWGTFILITWSSSDAQWLLSQPSSGVRVWELAAWMLSSCLCFPVPVQLQFWAQQQIPLILQSTFAVLKFKGSFWQRNLWWHTLWSRACAWVLSLWCKWRAAQPLLPWAGIGTKSCHPGCLTAYSDWHPLDLCGSADKCKSNGFFIWKSCK